MCGKQKPREICLSFFYPILVPTMARPALSAALLLALAVFGSLSLSAYAKCECDDKAPTKEYTCKQQAEYGACKSGWMIEGRFCASSCGRCKCINDCTCTDHPPSNSLFGCEDHKRFGNCHESWMKDGKLCSYTCGYCQCEGAPKLKDMPRKTEEKKAETKAPSKAPSAKDCKCTDIAPPNSTLTCKEQRDLGKCPKDWMKSGKWCVFTCGYCKDCPGAPKLEDMPRSPRPAGAPKSPKPAGTPKSPKPADAPKSPKPAGTPKSPKPAGTPQSAPGKSPRPATRPTNATAPSRNGTATAPAKTGTAVTRVRLTQTPPKPPTCNCTDIPPPNSAYTCEDQKNFGQCDELWMQEGQYCTWTCGMCTLPGCQGAPKLDDLPKDPSGSSNWVDTVVEETPQDNVAPAPGKAPTRPPAKVPASKEAGAGIIAEALGDAAAEGVANATKANATTATARLPTAALPKAAVPAAKTAGPAATSSTVPGAATSASNTTALEATAPKAAEEGEPASAVMGRKLL